MNLLFIYKTGFYMNGDYCSSIMVTNCPDIQSGYDFLSRILKSEIIGCSNLSHIPHKEGISPLRRYDFGTHIPVFRSRKR